MFNREVLKKRIGDWTVIEALDFLVGKGIHGYGHNEAVSDDHKEAISVVKQAIGLYGVEQEIYRGSNAPEPFPTGKILYGSPDPEVARFYGKLHKVTVKGIAYQSVTTKSVVTQDYSQVDTEVVFLA